MRVLGCSGGLDLRHEAWFAPSWRQFHDSAAVLAVDGRVVAAAEQERFDRLKHSNKFPIDAVRFCLDAGGTAMRDVDLVAYYLAEDTIAHFTARGVLDGRGEARTYTTRELLVERFRQHFDEDVSGKLLPVPHHWAHAVSAYAPSGFDASLVLTLDGAGDALSGAVLDGRGPRMTWLAGIPNDKSLGALYLMVTNFLGFDLFEEYKVMGLAGHGRPTRYRRLFQRAYTLEPAGDFTLDLFALRALDEAVPARLPGEPLRPEHHDVAAALQETLERIVLHVADHWRRETGHRHLCLAGGVAQNSTMNGRLLRAGLFERVFVQPAAHDAGCALGAALYPFVMQEGLREKLAHVYLGMDIGNDAEVSLRAWDGLIAVTRPEDICAAVADLLAEGRIIGWAQGRAEFGPRALGNRSIVADPRPVAIRDRVNQVVKKREEFRPLAPAVLAERAADLFELPEGQSDLPHMTFVVPVREEWRSRLGAVTHVDGTARIQTLAPGANARFRELLCAFERRTGVPALLNTSLNSAAEPIVNTTADALVCFLTTDLDALVVGDHLVTKAGRLTPARLAVLVPALPPQVVVVRSTRAPDGAPTVEHTIQDTHSGHRRVLSPAGYRTLAQADGTRTLDDLLDAQGTTGAAARHAVIEELAALWSHRLVALRPRAGGQPAAPVPRRSPGPSLAPKRFRDGNHRLVPPEETVRRVRRFKGVMGITRIADVTGLDNIGIPAVMVCRPNARSLAVAQGKGLTLAAARASGLMESIELYHAERISLPLKLASWEELRYTQRTVDVTALPRAVTSRFTPDLPLLWIEGRDLLAEESVWLPYEVAHANYTLPLPTGSGCFPMTSNGLASGNHPLEALVHALSEVVERDATTLWYLLDGERQQRTRLDLGTVDDPACRWVLERFDAARIDTAVWETTADIGIPSFLCLIAERAEDPLRSLYSATGMGCHPARGVALLRALTEAAQSRVTYISGARDDMYRRNYERYRNPDVLRRHRGWLVAAGPLRRFQEAPTRDHDTFDEDVTWLLDRLHAAGIRRVVTVDLSRPEFRIPVVRVIVPGLEGPQDHIPGYVYGGRARRRLDGLTAASPG